MPPERMSSDSCEIGCRCFLQQCKGCFELDFCSSKSEGKSSVSPSQLISWYLIYVHLI